MSEENRDQPNGRPFGVTVISAAMIVNAIVIAVRAYLGDVQLALNDILKMDFYFELAGPFVGAAGLVLSIGLWRLQRWAWVATMLWAGVNMAQALYGYVWAEPQFAAMALSVVIVLYLNQRDVQLAFLETTGDLIRRE